MLLARWELGRSAGIMLNTAAILFSGIGMTRLSKKLRLPDVTAYILAGILIGPYALGLVSSQLIAELDFITDAALAFIAFGVGQYFTVGMLRQRAGRMLILTLSEALAAAAAVTVCMLALGYDPMFSLLLGAIGCATAPASTIMTIRQYRARGEFVDTVLQVVALDDAVSIAAFSVCAALCTAAQGDGISAQLVIRPVILNVLSIGLGVLCGAFLSRASHTCRSAEQKLIAAVAAILALAGLCSAADVSPLLACMAMGTAYINFGGERELFLQVEGFTPPVMTMFFVLSGLRLEIPVLRTAGLAGVLYFAVRIAGKYAGAAAGAKLTHQPALTRRWLGLALVPQAGVSIGLAAMGSRLLPEALGSLLNVIILSSAVLYELTGPACARLALCRAGSFEKTDQEE